MFSEHSQCDERPARMVGLGFGEVLIFSPWMAYRVFNSARRSGG